MRRYPQRGFCRANCTTSSETSSGTVGRPTMFGCVHFLLTRRRCQASSVPGVHDPVQPQVPGQQPGQGGEHGTVSPVRFRAGDLPAQHRDLVPEDQDLCGLGGVASRQER
jgi:hypothetical protein